MTLRPAFSAAACRPASCASVHCAAVPTTTPLGVLPSAASAVSEAALKRSAATSTGETASVSPAAPPTFCTRNSTVPSAAACVLTLGMDAFSSAATSACAHPRYRPTWLIVLAALRPT